MATTRITDVIVPEIYDDYIFNTMLEKSTIIKSGLAVDITKFTEFLNSGGRLLSMPAWNQLTDEEPDVWSDDPAVLGTASKITAYKTQAVRLPWAKAWSAMQLAKELAGSDPLDQVVNSSAEYWDLQLQRFVLASSVGVLADNVDNDSGDMVNDITTAVSGTIGAANKFSAEAYIDTLLTMGDRMDEISTIMVHSQVYNTMQKENRIDFTPEAIQISRFGTYDGASIVVNDKMPVETVLGDSVYTTMIFGAGAYGLGVKSGDYPSSVDFVDAAGNNSGQEVLYNRMITCIHPDGFDFTDASVAGNSPTEAEYKLAANWDRKVDRKRAKIAFMKSNG